MLTVDALGILDRLFFPEVVHTAEYNPDITDVSAVGGITPKSGA